MIHKGRQIWKKFTINPILKADNRSVLNLLGSNAKEGYGASNESLWLQIKVFFAH